MGEFVCNSKRQWVLVTGYFLEDIILSLYPNKCGFIMNIRNRYVWKYKLNLFLSLEPHGLFYVHRDSEWGDDKEKVTLLVLVYAYQIIAVAECKNQPIFLYDLQNQGTSSLYNFSTILSPWPLLIVTICFVNMVDRISVADPWRWLWRWYWDKRNLESL